MFAIRFSLPPTVQGSRCSSNAYLRRTAPTTALRSRGLLEEVARIPALGARRITDEPTLEHGWTPHSLADPDGNEFCALERPLACWDRWPSSS